MIIKNFDLQKINLADFNLFLFYGENEGLKEDIINRLFLKSVETIKRYDENEIIEKKDDFVNRVWKFGEKATVWLGALRKPQ